MNRIHSEGFLYFSSGNELMALPKNFCFNDLLSDHKLFAVAFRTTNILRSITILNGITSIWTGIESVQSNFKMAGLKSFG